MFLHLIEMYDEIQWKNEKIIILDEGCYFKKSYFMIKIQEKPIFKSRVKVKKGIKKLLCSMVLYGDLYYEITRSKLDRMKTIEN